LRRLFEALRAPNEGADAGGAANSEFGHAPWPVFLFSERMHGILIHVKQATPMLQAAISETTAPCPKCRRDMVLAVVIPHPVALQLARHTYLCASCNQTKTYILPVGPTADCAGGSGDPDSGALPPDGEPDDRRRDPREALATPATIYDKDGTFLLPCIIRDLSKSGGRIELFKDAILPQYFLISLLPDGSGRRLCSKVWQLALVAGLRFAEKQTA
jgi:hypothetical protein